MGDYIYYRHNETFDIFRRDRTRIRKDFTNGVFILTVLTQGPPKDHSINSKRMARYMEEVTDPKTIETIRTLYE